MTPWRVSSSGIIHRGGVLFVMGCGACGAGGHKASAAALKGNRVGSLGERLAEEAAQIPRLLSPMELLSMGAYAVSAVLVAEGVAGAVRGLWRLGLDPERRLGRCVAFTRLALGLGVVSVVLKHFVEAAPTLSGAATILFAALAIATLRGLLENLAVGVGMMFHARFKPGDRIVLSEHSGTVREVGLTGVHLRSAEGTAVIIPNRLLQSHPLLVTKADDTASVVVTLPNVGELSPEAAERVRRIALLSPYRSIGTGVRTMLRSDASLEVEIRVQSSVLVGEARVQLVSAIRSALTDAS